MCPMLGFDGQHTLPSGSREIVLDIDVQNCGFELADIDRAHDSYQLSLTFIPRRVPATMRPAAELFPSSTQRKPEPESAREWLT